MNKKIYDFINQIEIDKMINIYRIIQEGSNILVHYLATTKTQKEVIFLILEQEREQFNIVKKVTTNYLGASPLNGRTQIDGETEIDTSEETAATKKIVQRFIDGFLLVASENKKYSVNHFISKQFYFQHNVDNKIGDGVEELQRSISEMQERGSDLKYDRIILRICQNNFCFLYSQQDYFNHETKNIELWEYFDLFRIKNGEIIEHWDIIKQVS